MPFVCCIPAWVKKQSNINNLKFINHSAFLINVMCFHIKNDYVWICVGCIILYTNFIISPTLTQPTGKHGEQPSRKWTVQTHRVGKWTLNTDNGCELIIFILKPQDSFGEFKKKKKLIFRKCRKSSDNTIRSSYNCFEWHIVMQYCPVAN